MSPSYSCRVSTLLQAEAEAKAEAEAEAKAKAKAEEEAAAKAAAEAEAAATAAAEAEAAAKVGVRRHAVKYRNVVRLRFGGNLRIQAEAEKKAAEEATANAAKESQEELDHARYSELKKQIKKLKKERDGCNSTKAGREAKKQLKQQIKELEAERDGIRRKWDSNAEAESDNSASSSPKTGGRRDGKLSNKERRRLEKETADAREKAAQAEALKKELEFSGANVANFSCTQPAMAEEQSIAWENSKDIFIEGFTITVS